MTTANPNKSAGEAEEDLAGLRSEPALRGRRRAGHTRYIMFFFFIIMR